MSTPESQQPKPGWEWYHPTTISGLQRRHNCQERNITDWLQSSKNNSIRHQTRVPIKKCHETMANIMMFKDEK